MRMNKGIVVKSYDPKTSYTFLDKRTRPAWGVIMVLNPTKPTMAITNATGILVRNKRIMIAIPIMPIIVGLILFLILSIA
jgi:hypothetical protein